MRPLLLALLLTCALPLQGATALDYTIKLGASRDHMPEDYLDRVRRDITHCCTHTEYKELPSLSIRPCVALIVGTGTAGVEALCYAVKALPPGSTFVIMQRNPDRQHALKQVLQANIPGAERQHFVVSPALDLGELDKIQAYLHSKEELLKHPRLYIHTADRAERFLPDALPIEETLAQITRRASAGLISRELDALAHKEDQDILKILVSSECAVQRNQYRIPNLGPYQMGKIVGDELFRNAGTNPSAVEVLLYSGAMATEGQRQARESEYEMLQPEGLSRAAFVDQHKGCIDIDPMDSVGMMLRKTLEAASRKELATGKAYAIYGPSVIQELGHEVGNLAVQEPAPYLWPKLEG